MPTDPPENPPGVVMGCLPRMSAPGEFLPILGEVDTAPLLPRNKWRDVDISTHDRAALNQGNQGSCTGCSFTSAFQSARGLAGYPAIDFAWSTLYGPANGGRDAGSALDAVVNHLMRVGLCPQKVEGQDYIDPFDWKGYYNGSWPADWQGVARNYRLLEAWDCPSFDHMISALHHGFISSLGVFWPGGGGHCVKCTGWDNTKRRFRIHNTWSPSWGERGYGWLDERVGQKGIPYFGAFTLRAITIGPHDPTPPTPK